VALDQLVEDYGDSLNLIRYYMTGEYDPLYSYNPDEMEARGAYYDYYYTPHLFIDGDLDAGYYPGDWEGYFIERFGTYSPLSMAFSGNYDASNRSVKLIISITAEGSITDGDLRFQSILTESGIHWSAPNGIDTHNQVMRDMIPNPNGEAMEVEQGGTVYFERNFILDNELKYSNCDLVAFVQSYASKSVYQSARVSLSSLPSVPPATVEAIPNNTPIITPAGSSFTFTGKLINNSDQAQDMDVWIMLDVPGYGSYGPIQNYNDIQINPYDTLIAAGIEQSIPIYAPLGLYNYISYCGDYPNTAIDSSMFTFKVISPSSDRADGWNTVGGFDYLKNPNTETKSQAAISNVVGVHNYPNPFNARTSINFTLNKAENIEIEIFNLRGEKLETLYSGWIQSGKQQVSWDASDYPSGIYFYKIRGDDFSIAKRVSLVK